MPGTFISRALARRELLKGTANLGAAAMGASLFATPALASILSGCTAMQNGIEPPTGDITESLEQGTADQTITIEPGIWLVSRNVEVRSNVEFAGGRLRPQAGVQLVFDRAIDAPTGQHLFDLAHVSWDRGERRRQRKLSSYVWQTDSGIRLPGTACASWFGATEGGDVDNTLAIQAMLDSGAQDTVLDGFYTHTANWLGNGQTLRGLAPLGGDGRYGLATRTQETSFYDVWNGEEPTSPLEDAFRGLTTKNNAGAVAFRDFEYDGGASRHFDHKDNYRRYRLGDAKEDESTRISQANFKRGRLRQGGITISMGDVAEAEGDVFVSPDSTLIDGVYIHDTIRSSLTANRAPRVTVRNSHFADSDVDHLIYADQNPDMVVENTEFSGHANAGMVVISCGTLKDCRFRNMHANPIDGLATRALLILRNDLQEPTDVDNLLVDGDLSAIGGYGNRATVFRVSGQRDAQFDNVSVVNRGPADFDMVVFAAAGNAQGIFVRGLTCDNMPAGAQLWSADGRVTNLHMSGVRWAQASGGSGSAATMMNFDALQNASFDGLTVQNARFGNLIAAGRVVRNVDVTRVSLPGGLGTMRNPVEAPAMRGVRVD